MRLAFVTTVEGIVSTIGPIFAGLLIGAVGFGPLLGLSLGFILISLAIMTFWVNEPRHRDRVEEMASLSSHD